MTMVGRKKKSAGSRNHFPNNNIESLSKQETQSRQVSNRHYDVNRGRRYTVASFRSKTVGSDSENTTIVSNSSYRRRPFNIVANSDYSKHQTTTVKNHIMHRSASREGGSASAGSVISAADDEGSPSVSGIEYETEESRTFRNEKKIEDSKLDRTERVMSSLREKFIEQSTDSAFENDKRCTVEQKDTTLACSASCSLGVQTDCTSACADVVIGISRLHPWERIEALAQIVYSLSALEQRFLGSCVEAAVRSNSIHLRQFETLYNEPQTVMSHVQGLEYHKLVDVAFTMICMLRSGSRQAGVLFLKILDQLLIQWVPGTINWTYQEKEEALIMLRSIVSAALNHSAIPVESKMRLSEIREHLNLMFQSFGLSSNPSEHRPLSAPECSSHFAQIRPSMNSSPSTSQINVPTVIASLDVIPTEEPVPDEYAIEVFWNDGTKNYVVKTADEIAEMHARLLNDFPNEAGAQTGNDRLLPYLNRAQPESVQSYIRSLSNLPARVLVSPVIYDVFSPCRLSSGSHTSSPNSLISRLSPSSKNTKTAKNSDVLEVATTSIPPMCVLQHAYVSTVAICSPANAIGTSNAGCIPITGGALPSPSVAPFVPLVPRPLPLRTVPTIATRPIFAIPPHLNVQSSCHNCGSSHSFSCCPHSTMLDAINTGTYNLNYGIPEEPKIRPFYSCRNAVPNLTRISDPNQAVSINAMSTTMLPPESSQNIANSNCEKFPARISENPCTKPNMAPVLSLKTYSTLPTGPSTK